MGQTQSIWTSSLCISHVCAEDMLGLLPWPPSRPQTLSGTAQPGWTAVSMGLILCLPCPPDATPTPWALPCLGCRVLRLLVAPKSSRCAPEAQTTPGSCAGHWGPLEHLLGHGGRVRGALKRPCLPAGCPKGFYGKHCRKKCHCANRGRCHRLYGACLCDPGLYGRFCHLSESCCLLAACVWGVEGTACSMAECSPCAFLHAVQHVLTLCHLHTRTRGSVSSLARMWGPPLVSGLKATSSGLLWPLGCLGGQFPASWGFPAPNGPMGGLQAEAGADLPRKLLGCRAYLGFGVSWQQG